MITDRQVIGELAAGGRIVCCDEGDGYSYKLIREQFPLTSSQVIRLLDEGWIYSSNTAYFLTDDGKKSYLRSTDELGDGRLLAPKSTREQPRGKGEEMTKATARTLAQQRADIEGIVFVVIRHKSKFAAMSLDRAKSEGFYIMEVVKPASTPRKGDTRE